MSNSARKIESQHDQSIVDVITSYGISLQKRSIEYWGRCPFHNDTHPSLSVNADKGLFLCRSCGVGGDVITFVEKIEGVDFKGAARLLGRQIYRPSTDQIRRRQEAKAITEWVRKMSRIICDELCEIGDELRICRAARQQKIGIDLAEIAKHEAGLIRRWALLADLDDDLNNPKLATALWIQRDEITSFVESLA